MREEPRAEPGSPSSQVDSDLFSQTQVIGVIPYEVHLRVSEEPRVPIPAADRLFEPFHALGPVSLHGPQPCHPMGKFRTLLPFSFSNDIQHPIEDGIGRGHPPQASEGTSLLP